MRVHGKHFRTIWHDPQTAAVNIIDQTCLPHSFEVKELDSLDAAANAIRTMQVRGAPLIGVAAVYGVYLALRQNSLSLDHAINTLLGTRPTAVNLAWALGQAARELSAKPVNRRADAALNLAARLANQDVATCEAIGIHGAELLQALWRAKADPSTPLQILTHCNAGWLATVDWGTALAGIYKARDAGVPVHVWVDETRPRNQGASLTAWELGQEGISHSLIADNTGGYLMQSGRVDVCLVGSDRTTAKGDVCNKIGTYLKALAAHDNHIPFYVALPRSSIDFDIEQGLTQVPIEERGAEEVSHISGRTGTGEVISVALAPAATHCVNYGFDITPARLVSGLITELGVCPAEHTRILALRHR